MRDFPHLPHAPAIVDRRHFTNEELGSWGMKWSDVTITGLIGGKVVATRRFVADPVPAQLELLADAECVYLHDGSADRGAHA